MIPDANLPAVVDAELVDDDAPATALTLFKTSDPKVALARMSEHAKRLSTSCATASCRPGSTAGNTCASRRGAASAGCSAFTPSLSGHARTRPATATWRGPRRGHSTVESSARPRASAAGPSRSGRRRTPMR